MFEVSVPVRSPERLSGIIEPERLEHLLADGELTRKQLRGRRVVSINSTASGGGVAEMLQVLLAYCQGVGVDARWLVLEGDAEFFAITKRLHHRIHGERGDGGPLGKHEREHLIAVCERNLPEVRRLLEPGDVVLLHDPQPAALAAWLSARGVPVVWRCHIGVDERNEYTEQAWNFLRPLLDGYVDQYIFTRPQYAPDWVDQDLLKTIKPSIDPFSPKNADIDDSMIEPILRFAGIIAGDVAEAPEFIRSDGSIGVMTHLADITRAGPAPATSVPMVVQVSRWDELKDMMGVMRAFIDGVEEPDSCLVLAGPDVSSVTDDPEGLAVLNDVKAAWSQLPTETRARVQIVCLPMDDPEENAMMVNALQRHAAIVVQKSIKEGFGLTVTEAMYKGRPVIASAVGGITDQIQDGVDGILLRDPRDLDAAGAAMADLLGDRDRAEAMGRAAKRTAIDRFLPDTSLRQWAASIQRAMEMEVELEGEELPAVNQ
ncbi:MAG: glycosyltransferase [Candidatus Nanopelagicales bacterium]